MDIVLFLITLALGLISLYLWHRKNVYTNVPGPTGVPVFFNTFQLVKRYDTMLDWFVENTNKYGPTWTFKVIGQPRFIVVTDPTNVEYILKKNFENYEKGAPFRERFHDVLGEGIFNSDGPSWKSQRKTASLMFSVRNFRDHMVDTFTQHGKLLLNKLSSVEQSQAIDIHDYFFRLTLDSIGEIGFGYNFGTLFGKNLEFLNAFDTAQYNSQLRFFWPLWKLRKLYSQDEKALASSVDTLNKFAEDIIERRLKDEDILTRRDLLSIFIARKQQDAEEPYYPRSFLRDLIMNFTIAGRDTTAQGLSWMFYLLSQHRDVEAKLIEEIDRVTGGQIPTFEMLKEMDYAHAVFSETLRLYPSVPKDIKLSQRDDVLPDGTRVPKGSWVMYPPYVMGRREELWEDALTFKPERWLNKKQPSSYKFPAFNAGPRLCLGKDMAYLEAKTVAAMILQKYTLRLVPGHVVRYQSTTTLPMENGLKVSIVPRHLASKDGA